MRHKVLLRAGWKQIFCIPGFEKVSPAGEGSDWVKEKHCCKSGTKVFLWFYVFFFFFFNFAFYYILCIESLEPPSDGDFLGLLLLAW